MSKELETDKSCEILADDDVIILANNRADNTSGAFTVKQLKQLLGSQIMEGIVTRYKTDSSSIKGELSTISIGSDNFVCRELNLTWIQVSCKHLKVGYGGWQEGELRVYISISNSYYKSSHDQRKYAIINNISVEFCPDRPPEIPLSLGRVIN